MISDKARQEILFRIHLERENQNHKFGVQNHGDLLWLAIFMEEAGEVSKAILEGTPLNEELIQSAAVIVAWLESRHRQEIEKVFG